MQRDRGVASDDTGGLFRIPERIPLFPLPNLVFFPRTYLPLHIFEPRYREMVADALAGGRCIGMVLLKDGWERDYYGNPPIFEVGCVGRLVNVEPLAQGRSNILLQGLHRFEIGEQSFDRNYRQSRILLKAGEAAEGLEPRLRAALASRLADYVGDVEDDGCWRDLFRPEVGDDVLVNNLATGLDVTPLEKQFLLEAESLPQRARRLLDLIQFKLCEQRGANMWGGEGPDA
jgi:Lon protease-like protein